jgi:DNA-binding NarL/FixJ family response regulator
MNDNPSVILFGSDREFQSEAERHLSARGYTTYASNDVEKGWEMYLTQSPDAVLLEAGPELDGCETLLGRISERDACVPLVLVADEDNISETLKTFSEGVWSLLPKSDYSIEIIEQVLSMALGQMREISSKEERQTVLEHELRAIRESLGEYHLQLSEERQRRRELEQELEQEQEQSGEMAVTLKTVIRAMDDETDALRREISAIIRDSIEPTLDKMVHAESVESREAYAKVVVSQLNAAVGGQSEEFDQELMQLTPTELEVARYIKADRSTTEIADMMHSALETVQTHRKNLRKKLGLVGKKTSLQMHLKSLKSL